MRLDPDNDDDSHNLLPDGARILLDPSPWERLGDYVNVANDDTYPRSGIGHKVSNQG